MKIVVTGHRGMIGSCLCGILSEQGHTVIGYDVEDGIDVRLPIYLAARMEIDQPEAVAHLAAIPHPASGYSWDDYWEANVCGTANVARAAQAAGVKRLVYTSSTTYYGAERSFPLGDDPLGVLSPNAIQRYLGAELPAMGPWPRVSLYYMISKIAAEAVLAAYGLTERLRVRIFRLCPCTEAGEPYAWGLRLRRERAAQALAAALVEPCAAFYQIENLCEPDVVKVES